MGLSEQTAEKLDVLADAEVGIEVLAQSLRHIGGAGADRGPMGRIRHAPVEDEGASRLDLARTGNDAQQRRLSDSVRPNESDRAPGREVDGDGVEGDRIAVTLRDALDASDRAL